MDTLLNVLKTTQFDRWVRKDTQQVIIAPGVKLYRTGQDQDSITYKQQFFSSWQVAAAYADEDRYFKTFTVNRKLQLLYVSAESLDFFVYKCLNRHTISDSDYKKLFNFVAVFGYRLHDLFPTMRGTKKTKGDAITSAYEYFQNWAKKLLKYDPHIQISESFGKNTEEATLFNRISLSKNDHEVFEALFTVKDPEVRAFLSDKSDGIYALNMRSGMFNKEMLITAIEEFPEEVFIREIHLPPPPKRIHDLRTGPVASFKTAAAATATAAAAAATAAAAAATAVIDPSIAIVWNSDFKYTNDMSETAVIESYCTPKSDYTLFTEFSEESITRIFLYTIIYKKLAVSIVDSINQMFTDVGPELTMYLRKLKYFNLKMKENMPEILVKMGRIIDVALVLDRELLDPERIPTQKDNPFYNFYDTSSVFNENLYSYTVMSNVIKAAIVGLTDLHEDYYNYYLDYLTALNNAEKKRMGATKAKAVNMELAGHSYMIPVASGGVLFGVYTVGDEFRRLTKDVDVKFILTRDHPNYGSEEFMAENDNSLLKQEVLHWNATMINFVWLNMIVQIFNETINHRSYIYAKKVNRLGRMEIQLKDISESRYVYAAGNPSTRILTNILAEGDLNIKRTYGDKVRPLSFAFNVWLGERKPVVNRKMLTSLADYNAEFTSLLAEKKEIKKIALNGTRKKTGRGKERETMKSAAGKATTGATTDVNSKLKQLSGLVKSDDFVRFCYRHYGPLFHLHEFIEKMNKKHRFIENRPKLLFENNPDHVYSVNWFSSIYVYKPSSPTDTFGLLDLTYDTHYSTLCSFTKYAGISEYGYISVDGLNYGSSLWFIHESDKLNKICNVLSYPGDNDADKNPENECAPDKLKREEKKRKYAERYKKVFEFFKFFLTHCIETPDSIVYSVLQANPQIVLSGASLEEIEQFLLKIFHYTPTMTNRDHGRIIQHMFDNQLIKAVNDVYKRNHKLYRAGF